MSEPTLDTVTQRLDRLEGESRRFKRVGSVVLATIAAAMLMGHSTKAERVVEADQFVLRDPSGKIRGELTILGDGGVRLSLYDGDWTPRARLEVKPDGAPGLSLSDKDGKIIWSAP